MKDGNGGGRHWPRGRRSNPCRRRWERWLGACGRAVMAAAVLALSLGLLPEAVAAQASVESATAGALVAVPSGRGASELGHALAAGSERLARRRLLARRAEVGRDGSRATPPVGVRDEAEPAMPAPELVRLHVGTSSVVSGRGPWRRILVSNPVVVAAVATRPAQVVLEGKQPGSSSVFLWRGDGSYRMLTVEVNLDVDALQETIRTSYRGLPIQARADGMHVLLSGTVPDAATAAALVKMAKAYSKSVVNSLQVAPPRQRQILLEVRFVEVDRTRLNQFGVNLLSTGAFNTPGVTSTQQFGTVGGADSSGLKVRGIIGAPLKGSSTEFGLTNLLNIFFFRPDLNFGALVQDLEQKNVLQILAEPNLIALPGQPASFLAGGEFPFPVVQGGANIGAVTIEFRPFGVRLRFVGTIEPGNVVRLRVAPEVSALDFSNAVTIEGFTIPAISTRRAKTVIELRDGQPFAIAGLLDQRTTAELRRMPGIASVPVLGKIFQSHSDVRSRSELMVLVQPHIIDPVGGVASVPRPPAPAMGYLNPRKFDRGLPKRGAPLVKKPRR